MRKDAQLILIFKGIAMGMAEVVPGVSGGTIAFITGIYETLIDTIKAVVRVPLKVLVREGIVVFWREINGKWLLTLLIGMVMGILVGVIGISRLLESIPPVVWSFFFGLIISSSLYIAQKIDRWSLRLLSFLLIGAGVAYGVTALTPASGSENLLFVFCAGAVAISALILPGISGSFILLILGMYTYILGAIKAILTEFDFSECIPVLVFALGCFVGLAVFSNFLSWTFRRFRNETLAVLTGFMLGSLNRIWPWRNTISWLDKNTGLPVDSLPPEAVAEEFKILLESNVWYSFYEGTPYLVASLVAFFMGLLAVLWLAKVEPSKDAIA